MQPLVFIIFLIMIITLLLLLSVSEALRLTGKKVPAVIVFGDSIVDAGNNNGLITQAKCNFPPYGKDFTGGVPTGRFSNGKVPGDIIAETLGVKDLVPAYLDPNLQPHDLLTGVTFASGGAGFDPFTSQTAPAISLSQQLGHFKEYISKVKGLVGENQTQHILEDSLYGVVVGSDDLANTYFTAGVRYTVDIDTYTNLMVNFADDFIKDMYNLGAKRILMIGIPPIGCVPSQRTIAGGIQRECVNNYNNATILFNKKLSERLDLLTKSLPGTRIVYGDVYTPLLDIIRNPKKYGFEVTTRGCCGSGYIEVTALCNKLVPTCGDDSKYVFWDSFHPTERAYKVLVNSLLQKYIPKLLN